MPPWTNPFRRRTSTQTLRTIDGDEDGKRDRFILPSNTKQVEEQTTAPKKLPASSADADEVRYFLYHLLTYKGNKIARRWPQWVLETCAYWSGTGAELRTWDEDFSLLVPKGAGYAKLDKSSKYVDSPLGDCRLHIGNVIERAVKKMKAEEGDVMNGHQEWIAKERGSSLGQDFHRKSSGSFSTMTDFHSNVGSPGYPTMNGSASCVSLPQSFAQQLPYAYATSMHPSIPAQYASSVHEPMSMRVGTAYRSSDESPASSGDSGFTNSTAKTTPPGSVEGVVQQPAPGRYGTRAQPLHPAAELTQQNLHSIYVLSPPRFQSMPAGNTSSDTGSCRSTLRPSSSQLHISSSYNHIEPSENLRAHGPHTHPGTHQFGWQEQPQQPPATYAMPRMQTSTDTLHRSLRNLQREEQIPRPGSPASTPSHASQIALKRNLSPSFQRRPPIGTNSLSYPQSDIAHIRDRDRATFPAPPSVMSSQPRPIAPSILGQFPIHDKPRVPHLNSFTSADRTFATASTDQFALTQGLYHYTRVTDPNKAYEVALKEKARMQGIMPSNLRGDVYESAEPDMRMLDPLTKAPMRTLFEVIEAKETLQGKRI